MNVTLPNGTTIQGIPDGTTKEQLAEKLRSNGMHVPDEWMAPEQSAAKPPQPTQQSAGQRAQGFVQQMNADSPLHKLDANSKPVPSPTMQSAAKAIGTSSALGGALAYTSPEILQGLGVAASFLPVVGPEAGAALTTMGTAMRAERVGSAVMGAVSGATSEIAGQSVEAAGGTKAQADGARLVGGMLTPSAAGVVGFVKGSSKVAWTLMQRFLGAEDAGTTAAVAKARENLASLAQAGQPQTAMHAMLQKGVEADRAAADAAANAHMARAHAEAARIAATDSDAATRLVDTARAHADTIRADAAKRASALEKAADGKLATANRVLAQAQPELEKVGQKAELSDIGNALREAAVAKQGAQIEAKNAAYKATIGERDAIVAAKEQAGQTIDQTPEMRAFKHELDTKLLDTPKGQAAAKGMAQVTEPGVLRAYRQVYDAINNREVPVGIDPETGEVVKKQFKTSFEALDHVRRRLGDAIGGAQDADGYAAIGKQAARTMYAKIANIQEKFVGENAAGTNPQTILQQGYADAKKGLEDFGSKKVGKKLTATDRLGLEHVTDPKDLPKHMFSSQQSVRDARELTGNAELVNGQAAAFAARSMQGMDSKGAQKWVRENQDWMREVPGLPARATAYVEKLSQIERVSGKLGKRADLKGVQAKATVGGAANAAEQELQAGVKDAHEAAKGSLDTQERVLKEGQAKAEQVRAEAFEPSAKLGRVLGSNESPAAVRKLLLTGRPEQTRLAAQHLANTPGGREALEGSVRQVLRDMNEGTLRKQWTERVLPMLRDGKMLPPERLRVLQSDVERLLASHNPKEGLSLVKRHIAAAIGTAGGSDL